MIEALKQLVDELNERWRIASLKHINQANIHALGEAHAYDYIANRLRKIIQRGGWISADSDPDRDGWYLVTDGKDVWVAAYAEGIWGADMDVVTHWQPLPEPPKEDEEE